MRPAPVEVFEIWKVNELWRPASISQCNPVIAYQLQKEGKKVILGAGDTFRAAASDQLKTWAQRVNCEIVTSQPNTDPSAVAFETLQEFLMKYAPLQLIGDRKHSSKLAIGRRLLSSCSYMYSAKTLVEEAASKKEDLKDVLFVDGRSGLPHPLWKPCHDAVLIKSITRHGWVDREKACRAMVNDSEIKWGYPFEIAATENRAELSEDEMSDLRTTAQRAAAFLESFPEVIEALKGCSRQKVIESYGLRHRVDEEEGGIRGLWALRRSHDCTGGAEGLGISLVCMPVGR